MSFVGEPQKKGTLKSLRKQVLVIRSPPVFTEVWLFVQSAPSLCACFLCFPGYNFSLKSLLLQHNDVACDSWAEV